jgi:hypothetical protein
VPIDGRVPIPPDDFLPMFLRMDSDENDENMLKGLVGHFTR